MKGWKNFSRQTSLFAGHRVRTGNRKMCYTSMRPEPGTTKGEEDPHCWGHMYPAREQEVRLRSAVCPAGQHPRGARRPLASPPPRPAAAEPGNREVAGRMKGGAARRLRTPSSSHLARGGSRRLRFSPKEEEAGPAPSAATRSLGREGGRAAVHAAGELTEQSAERTGRRDAGGGRRGEGEDSPQLFATAWG